MYCTLLFEANILSDCDAMWQALEKTGLLPSREVFVEEHNRKLQQLGDDVLRNIPELLLATMNILLAEYTKHKWVENQHF